MGYRLDNRGLIPGRNKIFLFSTASRPAVEPNQLLVQLVPGATSMGVKRPGSGADHSSPFSAEVSLSYVLVE
jgi:hypothetical protein